MAHIKTELEWIIPALRNMDPLSWDARREMAEKLAAAEHTVSVDEAERICRADYFNTVSDTAQGIYDDWFAGNIGEDRDDLLQHITEVCDGHSQVIYTANAMDTLRFSDNDARGIQDLGSSGFDWSDGIPWSALAFHAFEADVNEQLDALGLDVNDPKKKCKGDCGEHFSEDELDSDGKCEDCHTEMCEECLAEVKASELDSDGLCETCADKRAEEESEGEDE